MKIVSVMTTDSRGGAEFAAVEMLDALRSRGHQVVMISDQPGIGRETGVEVAPIAIGPKLSLRSWRGLLRASPTLVSRLRGALEAQWPYDVLLLHYKKEQIPALALPERLTRTLFWCEWGPVPFPLRQGIPNLMYRLAARRAALVLAISAGTKRSVADVGVPESKIHVINNAMRIDSIAYTETGRRAVRDRLGIPADAFVVGCISRFHPKKRNDVVVEAVKRLDGAHVVLGGDGETEADLRERAAPMNGRAHFIPTPGGDVDEVLSAFDVSVFCPSPTEGQPRAVILGMLAERPCVSTGAEGVADMITPDMGAICSPENDPAALAEVLARYQADPGLRASHGRVARRIAESEYAAPVVAQRLEEMFAAAVDHARARR